MNKWLECVAALKDVRRYMHNVTDPRVVAALDRAIARLEGCIAEGGPTNPSWPDAVAGAFAVLGDVLSCCAAVAELVKYFGS
jgi:hypothetical protein